jgi:UDP-GlcNAc:undecaprenyl-phosphate GlcNAc-1-phosphate transferase
VISGWACRWVALKFRIVDRPGNRKIHSKPVAYLGGLAWIGAVVGGALGAWTVAHFTGCLAFNGRFLAVGLIPAVTAAGLGLYDDLFEMRARNKFLIQLAIALTFSLTAYRFSVIGIPGLRPILLSPALSVLLTTFFMVSVANALNLIDGSDGLCLGSASVTLALITVLAQWQGQTHFALLALLGLSACLGLLAWNLPPAKMYMGDSGSLGIGFMIAGLLVALGAGAPHWVSATETAVQWAYPYRVLVALLLVGLPALEISLTVARRSLQGRSLGVGDQGHYHHRMRRLGFGPLAIALTAILTNALSGGIVLAVSSGERGVAILLVAALAVLVGLGLQKLGYMDFFQRGWQERRPHFAVAHYFAAMQTSKLKLARSREEILALIEQTCHEFGVQECRVTLRSQGGGYPAWTWNYIGGLAVSGQSLAWDRVRLSGTRNHAAWGIHQNEREAELSMNLRVLMSEFMRKVLDRLVEVETCGQGVAAKREELSLRAIQRMVSVKALQENLESA